MHKRGYRILKQWKKYLSGFLATTILLSSGGINVAMAADNADHTTAQISNIQEDVPATTDDGNTDSDTENGKNELTFEELFQKEEPFKEFSDLKDEQKRSFLQTLSMKQAFQFVKLYEYLFTKSISVDEKKSLDDCWMVFQFWKDKQDEFSKIAESEIINWENEAITLIPDHERQYVNGENVEKSVVDFLTYGEYLQTIKQFDVKKCLDLLSSFNTIKLEEDFAKAKEEFSDFYESIYGFEDKTTSEDENISGEEPAKDQPDIEEDNSNGDAQDSLEQDNDNIPVEKDENTEADAETGQLDPESPSEEENDKLAHSVISIEGIELNDIGLFREYAFNEKDIKDWDFDYEKTMLATLANGEQNEIHVEWIMQGKLDKKGKIQKSENLMNKKPDELEAGTYVYQMELEDDYAWDESILEKFSNEEYVIPFIRLTVEKENIISKIFSDGTEKSGMSWVITPVYSADYIEVLVNAPSTSVASVEAPTWKTSDGGGKATWWKLDKGSYRNGAYNYGKAIFISNYGYFKGSYTTHIYAKNSSGALVYGVEGKEYTYGSVTMGNIWYEDVTEALNSSWDGAVIYVKQNHTLVNTTQKALNGTVYVKAADGAKEVSFSDKRPRIIIYGGTVVFGDTGGNRLTFNKGNYVNSGDASCGPICLQKNGSGQFKNCGFIGSQASDRSWFVHVESANSYFEACTFSGIKNGIGSISNLATKPISVNIKNSTFTNVSGQSVHMNADQNGFATASVTGNTFNNCSLAAIISKHCNVSANVNFSGNTYRNCARGVLISDDSGSTTTTLSANISSDTNYGGTYTGDRWALSSTDYQTGIKFRNAPASITNSSYTNLEYGVTAEGNLSYTVSLYNTVSNSNKNNSAGSGPGNAKNKGAGLCVPGSNVTVNVQGGNYKNNISNEGAGIFTLGTVNLYMYNSSVRPEISGNTANYGGGVYIGAGGKVLNSSGLINSNTSHQDGGGVFNAGTFTNKSYVDSNWAGRSGGGIRNNGTVNMESGSISWNTANATPGGGGVFSASGCRFNGTGGKLEGNVSNQDGGAIKLDGTVTSNFNNMTIKANRSATQGGGIWSNAPITLSNTAVTNNTAGTWGGGVFTNSNATLTNCNVNNNTASSESGGGIYLNYATLTLNDTSVSWNTSKGGGGGIATYAMDGAASATLNFNSGTITGNSTSGFGSGIALWNNTVLNQKAGLISENTESDAGIYVNGTYNFSGGTVSNNENNDIYLNTGKIINWWGHTQNGNPVITSAAKALGTALVKFMAGDKLGSTAEPYFKLNYPDNPEFIGRGGNRNGNANDSLVISRKYDISYNSNTEDTVSNLPEAGVKYWNEKYIISDKIPVWDGIRFKGWNTEKNASDAKWQPKDEISAKVNSDQTLYAIWEEQIMVVYDGNGATSGNQKTEIVTWNDCEENNGYDIKKNKGYTNFEKTNNTLAGWDPFPQDRGNAKEVLYPEKKENQISFEELKKIADQQKEAITKSLKTMKSLDDKYGMEQLQSVYDLELYKNSDTPVATMKAMWDEAPKIESKNKEYYEGERVTKEDLLKDISARDREDGDLTPKLKITRIEYADGKLMDGEKQPGEVKEWPQGMPDDELLDTWFLQLDKDDSPVTHKVTYQVTDSAGNAVEKVANVKVKYNEFPVIEAEDRYFTLEEAQNGVITEELLLKGALDSGDTKVTDMEDDQLYPETISSKLEIMNFHPEEFTSFTDSGYVVLTYHVMDSMGKETTCQFTVYVVKDGEIPEKPVAKKVRFISKKYYDLNAGINPEELSDEEKEYYNTNGGLNVESKWYHDPEYVAEIEECWDETKPSDQIWEFKNEDVEQVRAYVDEHGIGNSMEENALSEFVEEFEHCKVE